MSVLKRMQSAIILGRDYQHGQEKKIEVKVQQ